MATATKVPAQVPKLADQANRNTLTDGRKTGRNGADRHSTCIKAGPVWHTHGFGEREKRLARHPARDGADGEIQALGNRSGKVPPQGE